MTAVRTVEIDISMTVKVTARATEGQILDIVQAGLQQPVIMPTDGDPENKPEISASIWQATVRPVGTPGGNL